MMEMFSNWADWTPQLFRGLQVSLRLVGLALLFGLPLGLALALASSAKTRLLRYGAIVIVEIGRGAPALVVLQMVYYGLPTSGLNVNAFTSGAIALALTKLCRTLAAYPGGLPYRRPIPSS